jgi:hypothetical protein
MHPSIHLCHPTSCSRPAMDNKTWNMRHTSRIACQPCNREYVRRNNLQPSTGFEECADRSKGLTRRLSHRPTMIDDEQLSSANIVTIIGSNLSAKSCHRCGQGGGAQSPRRCGQGASPVPAIGSRRPSPRADAAVIRSHQSCADANVARTGYSTKSRATACTSVRDAAIPGHGGALPQRRRRRRRRTPAGTTVRSRIDVPLRPMTSASGRVSWKHSAHI